MRNRIALLLLAGLLAAPSARACSIPVFRYALEKWAPSKYELIIFHQGKPGPDHQKQIQSLRDGAAPANVLINTIDLSSNLEPNIRRVWERVPKDTPLPHVVLRYPEAGDKTPHVWTGPIGSPDLNGLLGSPARNRLFERLTLGDTASIILLLSGDEKADAGAREFLAKQTPVIAGKITLPEQTKEGPQIRSLLPLSVRFSVVEVRRDGPEALLAAMLLNSEDGLAEEKGPIAFPVYGRGRALCSLHGPDLVKPDELHKSLEYVCRACSCQVKELNPGVDLLMSGDWDTIFEAERGPAPRNAPMPVVETGPTPRVFEAAPEPKSQERPAPGKPLVPEYRSAPANDYPAVKVRSGPAEERAPSRPKPVMIAAAAGLVLLSVIWVWRSRSPSQPSR